MEDLILQSFFKYYGLDWLAFLSGIIGMYLLTKKSRFGFVFSSMSSTCGFAVAALSLQFGFIVYNALLVSMMVKGYMDWAKA